MITAVVSGRRRYAQSTVQSSSRIVPTAPHDPRDVPRQQRPRREQRQHPRGVDVGQERPGRVVRIAAVEPDPHAGPIGPGVGAGRLAATDHPGRQQREDQAEEEDRDDPAMVVEPRHLAPDGPPEDARPAPRRLADEVLPADHDPPATAGRARDGMQFRWRLRVGHRAGILPRVRARSGYPVANIQRGEPSPTVTDGHRHHHRRRGGQGPRPRHPQPLRRARRRSRRDRRRHLDRVVARLRGRRALQAGLRRARRREGPDDPRDDPRPGQRRDRGPRPARRDRHLHDRRQPAPPVVDDRRHAPGRRGPRAVPQGRGRRRARAPAPRRCRAT